MKKELLFIALLFNITLFGQIPKIKQLINFEKTSDSSEYNNNIGVYKWEVYTAKGSIIYGMSKSKVDAQWIINDLSNHNKKNTYKPIIGSVIKKSETSSFENVNTFKKKHPKGYKVLLPHDVIALRMIRVKSLNAAAGFIESATKKSNTEAFEYVFKLNNDFKSYSIKY